MTMLVVVMMAATVPAIPLSEIRTMSPAAAGARLLAGQPHAPIVAMRDAPRGSLPTPGVTEIELDERATALGRGCAGRRWTASFQAGRGEAEPMLTSVRTVWRVAPVRRGACGALGPVTVNRSIGPAKALDLVGTVAAIARRRPATVAVTCRTDIGSGLCDDRGTLLRRVVAKGAWLVLDAATVVYGIPGQVTTSVTLSGDPVRSVAVVERIPAPF